MRGQRRQRVLQNLVDYASASRGVGAVHRLVQFSQAQGVVGEELKGACPVGLDPAGAPHRVAVGELRYHPSGEEALVLARVVERASKLLDGDRRPYDRPRLRFQGPQPASDRPLPAAGDGQLTARGRALGRRRSVLDYLAGARQVEVVRGRGRAVTFVQPCPPESEPAVGPRAHRLPQLVLREPRLGGQIETGLVQGIAGVPVEQGGGSLRGGELALDQSTNGDEVEPEAVERVHRR